eukprot:TRINITY_DN5625_c0_g1::TRINITY_DN5625_c0_g1_i1::g.12107::m.12107 TRINITY_DN5625_c0_g1::TRINITY_DN5625_c0_g1_i1::g.12107  ORF type:complete len:452 (+),score=38.89 TRINITY_DN5625_c0_g1_i1:150-1505(+)
MSTSAVELEDRSGASSPPAETKVVLSLLHRLYRDPTVELISIAVEISAEYLAQRIEFELAEHGFRLYSAASSDTLRRYSADICELKSSPQNDTWTQKKHLGPESFNLCKLRFQFHADTSDANGALVAKPGETISPSSVLDYSLTFRCCSRPKLDVSARWDVANSLAEIMTAMFKSEVGMGFYYVKSTDFRLFMDFDIPNDTTLVRNPPMKPYRLTFPLLSGTLVTDAGESVVVLDYSPQTQHICKLFVSSRRVPPLVISSDAMDVKTDKSNASNATDICSSPPPPRRRNDKRRPSFDLLPPVVDSDPEDFECDFEDSQCDLSSSTELMDSADDADCYACDPDLERWDLDAVSTLSSHTSLLHDSATATSTTISDLSQSPTVSPQSKPSFHIGQLFGLVVGAALTIFIGIFLGCLDSTVGMLSRYLRLSFNYLFPNYRRVRIFRRMRAYLRQ